MSNSDAQNIFIKAREKVGEEIDQFVLVLNQKKLELFTEIELLETEDRNQRKQKQTDVQKLAALKSQTEELGQNSLVEVQHKILEDIQTGINKMNLECLAPPDFEIQIEWGFCNNCLSTKIRDSKIVKVSKRNSTENVYPIVNSPTSSLEEDLRIYSLRTLDRDNIPLDNEDWDVADQDHSDNVFERREEFLVDEGWVNDWDEKADVPFDHVIRQDYFCNKESPQDAVPKTETYSFPGQNRYGYRREMRETEWDRDGFVDPNVETQSFADPKKQKKRRNRKKNKEQNVCSVQNPPAAYEGVAKNVSHSFQPAYRTDYTQLPETENWGDDAWDS